MASQVNLDLSKYFSAPQPNLNYTSPFETPSQRQFGQSVFTTQPRTFGATQPQEQPLTKPEFNESRPELKISFWDRVFGDPNKKEREYKRALADWNFKYDNYVSQMKLYGQQEGYNHAQEVIDKFNKDWEANHPTTPIENSPSWTGKWADRAKIVGFNSEDEVKQWQQANGLVADGKFGYRSARKWNDLYKGNENYQQLDLNMFGNSRRFGSGRKSNRNGLTSGVALTEKEIETINKLSDWKIDAPSPPSPVKNYKVSFHDDRNKGIYGTWNSQGVEDGGVVVTSTGQKVQRKGNEWIPIVNDKEKNDFLSQFKNAYYASFLGQGQYYDDNQRFFTFNDNNVRKNFKAPNEKNGPLNWTVNGYRITNNNGSWTIK